MLMKYLLMICEDRTLPERSPSEEASLMAEYAAFTQEIAASGELVGGEQLERPGTATSVRVRAGETLVTDGPFAETAEQIGGYYVVDVADLDRALELAARVPSARTGVVEVRPVVDVRR
jgi:hypothetical protein